MFLEITIIILSLALIFLLFLLYQQKTKTQLPKEPSQDPQITSLLTKLDNSHKEAQTLKERIV